MEQARETFPFLNAVIPTQAGIHSAAALDTGFRR
jgi:hypothetical protein